MSREVEIAMSCRAIGEKLNEALAAGNAEALDCDAALHMQACGACRDYYNMQSGLYAAIDSGVQRLVENVAPPALLPGVRERLAAAEAHPNRVWVRAVVPSSVALLVASGLLLLTPGYMHQADESRTTLVQPVDRHAVPPASEQLSSAEGQTVVSNDRPKTAQRIATEPERVLFTTAPVVVDPQETGAFVPMANEIAKNPEFALAALHKVPSAAQQAEAIEPLNIAKLDLPALAEEKE